MNKETPQEIEIVVWHRTGGGSMINTNALDHDHPMFPYNQVKAMGLVPEHYGLKHPLKEEYEDKSREYLIDEIMYLKDQINSMIQANEYGFPYIEGFDGYTRRK